MTNAELERAKELKRKLDVAWKQVHEFTTELETAGYEILFTYPEQWIERRTEITGNFFIVRVLKTETIEL